MRFESGGTVPGSDFNASARCVHHSNAYTEALRSVPGFHEKALGCQPPFLCFLVRRSVPLRHASIRSLVEALCASLHVGVRPVECCNLGNGFSRASLLSECDGPRAKPDNAVTRTGR